MFWTNSNCKIETRISEVTDLFFEAAFAGAEKLAGKGNTPNFGHLRNSLLSLGNAESFNVDDRLTVGTTKPLQPILALERTWDLPGEKCYLSKYPFDLAHSTAHSVGKLAMVPLNYGEIGIPAIDMSFYGVDYVSYIEGIFAGDKIQPMNYSLDELEAYTARAINHYTRKENSHLFNSAPKAVPHIADKIRENEVGISIGEVLHLTARGLVVRDKVEQHAGKSLNNLTFDQFFNLPAPLLQLSKNEDKTIKEISAKKTFPKPIISGNFSAMRVFVSGLSGEYNSRT